jgi:hypothetical protein
MTKRLLFASASFAISCAPSTTNPEPDRSNSAVAKTNVNAENSTDYSRSENAYTFAQNSAFTRDLTPSGKAAREIVGKTVTESKLWQNKVFSDQLRKLMGPDYATMKKFWNEETPIKKFGDFLMMTGCEQHNCGDNQYVILIDLGDGRINVIYSGKNGSKEWTGNRRIDDLPPPFEESLAAMRSDR